MGRPDRGLLLAAAAVLLVAAPALAQERAPDGAAEPAWSGGWRPLAPVAALPRPAVAVGERATPLLLSGDHRVGLFWTAGHPAGLVAEVEGSETTFSGLAASEDGSFRRPLDPESVSRLGVRGRGRGPVGDWGAAVGEVAGGQVDLEPAVHAHPFEPYDGSPFVLTDTARFGVRARSAELQGGLGVRLGSGWAAGLGVGYGADERRTRAEPDAPRTADRTAAGVTAGVARELLGGDLRVGVQARWRRGTEDMSIVHLTGPSPLLHPLEGFHRPSAISLTGAFRMRVEREGRGVGAGAAGRSAGWRWAVGGRRGWASERHTQDPFGSTFRYRWETTRTGVRAAGARPLGGALSALIRARWHDASAEGFRPDLEEPIVRTESGGLRISSELLVRPEGSPWAGAGRLRLGRRTWSERDRLASIGADLTLWTPGLGLSVAREIGSGLAAALAWDVTAHDGVGAVPSGNALGEVYGRLIAPELALAAQPAVAQRATLTVRWTAAPGTDLWALGTWRGVSPAEVSGTRLAARPEGTRTEWRLQVGVRLRD